MKTPGGKPTGLMVAIGMPKDGAPGGDDSEGRPSAPDSDTSNQDCVPLSALAMPDPDAGDQMNTPQVGDRVTYTVEGTVASIDGEEAYVKREAINGQPVSSQSDAENEDQGSEDQQDQADRSELGSMAEGMGGYS